MPAAQGEHVGGGPTLPGGQPQLIWLGLGLESGLGLGLGRNVMEALLEHLVLPTSPYTSLYLEDLVLPREVAQLRLQHVQPRLGVLQGEG